MAGNPVGSTVPVNNVNVVDGLFTVTIDFGVGVFDGDARWLGVGVRSPAWYGQGGEPPLTTLQPRQPLTATPYALFALAGNEGPAGPPGEQGPPGLYGMGGQDGTDGADGLACWDLNGNGVPDPEEDTNGDGSFDALDCQGPPGDSSWQLNSTDTYYDDGNVGIRTLPQVELDVNGDVHVNGAITKEYAPGSADPVAPIAYGLINGDGTVATATPNVPCTTYGGGYLITIAGENYVSSDYVTVVTSAEGDPDGPDAASAMGYNGDLVVSFEQGWHSAGGFQFITCKPTGTARMDGNMPRGTSSPENPGATDQDAFQHVSASPTRRRGLLEPAEAEAVRELLGVVDERGARLAAQEQQIADLTARLERLETMLVELTHAWNGGAQ